MRVGFDMNGVLTNPTPVKVEVARLLGKKLAPEYAIRRTLSLSGMDYPTYKRVQELTFWTSEALRMEPVDGAIDCALGRLAAGDEVYFVSNLAPPGVPWGRQWLAEHKLPPNGLISVGLGGCKSLVLGAGFDAYVDDKPDIIKDLGGVVDNLYLLDTPQNQGQATPERVTRVENLRELDSILGRLHKE